MFVMGGKLQATGSAALWLVSSVASGSMSGYSLDNHSKPGCLPIAQSGGRVVNLPSGLLTGVKGVRGEEICMWCVRVCAICWCAILCEIRECTVMARMHVCTDRHTLTKLHEETCKFPNV